MRHSAATIALDDGVALAVVQEMFGHSDIRVTRGYTHVSALLAQDAAAQFGRALFGETATKDHDPKGFAGIPAGQVEPPIGIEPMTYSLRDFRHRVSAGTR